MRLNAELLVMEEGKTDATSGGLSAAALVTLVRIILQIDFLYFPNSCRRYRRELIGGRDGRSNDFHQPQDAEG
jgi:hypothetical protein